MRTLAAVCTIAASVFIGASARADLFDPADLDQYQNDWSQQGVGNFNVGDPVMMAQTFTAGKEGTLYGIEIGLPPWSFTEVSSLTVEIYQGPPNSEWMASLASFTLAPPPSGLVWYDVFNNYHLNSPILNVPVDVGTTYSIVLSATGGVAYVGATDSESYGPGTLWRYDSTEDDPWLPLNDPSIDYGISDMQFRTYVEAVPLPAGLGLGILGLGVAGWRLRRQMA
jgi:hypothetical protein